MLILCIADVERDVGMKNLSPKEAIAILSDMKIDIPLPKAAVTQIKRNLALDMAINALNCSEIPNNSDVISRQAALETIRTMQTYKLFAGDDMILVDKAQVQTELMILPTVQPEQRWIPCSERLPEKEGWYITTVESEKTGKRRIENDLFAVDIALAHGHTPNKFCKDGYRQRTVAWMPFPEPYQKRGDQDGTEK